MPTDGHSEHLTRNRSTSKFHPFKRRLFFIISARHLRQTHETCRKEHGRVNINTQQRGLNGIESLKLEKELFTIRNSLR